MTASDECLGHVHGRSRTERHADSGWMASRRVDGGASYDGAAPGFVCGEAGCKASAEYKTFHLVNFL